MLRIFAQLLLVLLPLSAYVCWLLYYVQRALSRGERWETALMVLGGLLALTVVEGLLFKLYLLPTWARALSERLYAGSYLPQDDPLAALVHQIESKKRPELIPDLIRLVESDPYRVRAWLELARLLEPVDAPQAVHHLLRGAEIIASRRLRSRSSREDTALLLWRAATLSQKYADLAHRAPAILEQLTAQYADTAYGKHALKHSGK